MSSHAAPIVGKVPILIGSSGLVTGESFVLGDPCDVVIGRSRSCEVSLQSARRYLGLSDDERARLDDFNSVSRRHVRLTVIGSRARLDNLSQAGTVCNDQRFDRVLDVDLAAGPAVIRLSANESLTLALADKEQIADMLAKTQPLRGEDPMSTTPLSSAIRRPVDVGEVARPSTRPSHGAVGDASDTGTKG